MKRYNQNGEECRNGKYKLVSVKNETILYRGSFYAEVNVKAGTFEPIRRFSKLKPFKIYGLDNKSFHFRKEIE